MLSIIWYLLLPRTFFLFTMPSRASFSRQFLLSQCPSQFLFLFLISYSIILPSPTLSSTTAFFILSVHFTCSIFLHTQSQMRGLKHFTSFFLSYFSKGPQKILSIPVKSFFCQMPSSGMGDSNYIQICFGVGTELYASSLSPTPHWSVFSMLHHDTDDIVHPWRLINHSANSLAGEREMERERERERNKALDFQLYLLSLLHFITLTCIIVPFINVFLIWMGERERERERENAHVG